MKQECSNQEKKGIRDDQEIENNTKFKFILSEIFINCWSIESENNVNIDKENGSNHNFIERNFWRILHEILH
jgi:hypothetical protein